MLPPAPSFATRQPHIQDDGSSTGNPGTHVSQCAAFLQVRRLPISHLSCRAPIEPEVLAKIKDEVFHKEHLAALDTNHSHATILTYPPISVREFNVPMYRNLIGVRRRAVLNVKAEVTIGCPPEPGLPFGLTSAV